MKYFTNAYASFRKGPSTTAPKWQDLPEKTVVEYLGEPYFGWGAVEYMGKLGYIANTLIERYWETLPKNCVKIDNQTLDPNDLEQYYLTENGVKVVNACGELCISYALGFDLQDFMETWEIKIPSLWKRLWSGGKLKGTTSPDLIQMCAAFTVEAKMLEAVTLDPWLKRSRYTPAVVQRLAETGYPIVSCKIGNDGKLRGQGILHWVLVIKVEPERTGGIVTIYNPAGNRWEEHTYAEWLASCVQPYGIWIPKDAL